MNRHPNQQQMKFHSSQTGPPAVNNTMFLPSQSMWPSSNPGIIDPSTFAKMQQYQSGMDPRTISTTGMSSAAMNLLLLQQQMNAALLTQSMDSAGEVSNSIGSDDMSFTAAGMNNMLMKMEIPTSNFTKAINFEAISDEAIKSVDINDEEEYENEGEYESGDDQESLVQNSFDTSSDLLEQQQAQQQSSLLDKFKQLREWQHKQQEMLMVQQQQQLQKLREEQERVQRMVAKQREMQWGVSNGGKNGLATTVPHNTSVMGSPRKTNVRPASISMAKTLGVQSSVIPNTVHSNISSGQTAVRMQPGRPVPTFLQSQQNGNMRQNLGQWYQATDSDNASQYSITEEGIFPLPDSEVKKKIQHNSMTSRHISHENHLINQDQITRDLQSANGFSRGHRQDVAENSFPAYHENGCDSENKNFDNCELHHDDYIESVSDTYEDDVEEGDLTTNEHHINVYRSDVDNDSRSVPVTDGLDFRESWPHEKMTMSPRDLRNVNKIEADVDYSDEESYEESNDEEPNDSCHCEGQENADFDDMPVAGLGSKKKTFEELLEEELRKEEERQKQGSVSPSQSGSGSKKKKFLRRGEGIARFANGSAGRRPKKSDRRTRSRSRGPEKNASVNNDVTDQRVNKGGSGGSGDGPNSTKQKTAPTNETPPTRGLPPKGARKILTNNINQKPPQAVKKNQQRSTQPQSQRPDNKPPAKPQSMQSQQLEKKRLALKKPATTNSAKNRTSNVGPTYAESGKCAPECIQDTPSKYSDTSSLGETSFQARLTARAEMEVYEKDDLEEFELLEQYADDNASFLSNISTVNKVVQNKRGPNAKMPSLSNIVRNPVSQVPESKQATACVSENDRESALATAETRMDSESCSDTATDDDTSVSTDFDEEETSENKNGEKSVKEDDLDRTLVDSPEALTKNQVSATDGMASGYAVKPMQRKVAVKSQAKQQEIDNIPVSRNLLASVQQFSDSDADLKNSVDSDVHSVNNDEDQSDNHYFGAKPAVQTKKLSQKQHNGADGINSSEGADKNIHIYQPGDRYVETTDDEKSVSDVLETKRDKDGKDPVAFHLDFNDEDAWNESHCEDERETPTSSESLNANKVIRKSILNRETLLPKPATDDTVPPVPPTSQLVGKLFPKLKQEKPKPKIEPRDEQKLALAKQTEPNDGIQSKQLRDKLVELEQEIEKFRSENNTLGRLRKEREDGLVQLKKEMVEFEKQKDEELKRLQEFKSDEVKKLKRERKQFEVYQQNIRAMPNKKEREEIDTLKTQLSELQDEVKRKESRWNSSMARLREKCESLTSENEELKEEIRILEKQRITAWQKKDVAPKVKEEARATAKNVVPAQQMKSPIPQSQPSTAPPRDNQLRLSTNLDLNDSDLRAAEEPPTPHSALLRLTDNPLLNRTGQSTGLPLPQSDLGGIGESKRPIPRKRAVPQIITDTVDKGNEEYEEVQHPDGKVEKIYTNGAREILFANGTRKQVSSDGQSIIVSFFNGDMKQILPDQRVVYYYADAQTTHTTYPDGLEILQFPNQQMEKHYPDGTKEITFPDQTIKYLFPNGVEESIYADGTVIRIEKSGDKTVEFPNGQREIHTEQYKRREYPDGTVKTVYPDGRQETRYSSGRVRVKDIQGNVIVDKRM